MVAVFVSRGPTVYKCRRGTGKVIAITGTTVYFLRKIFSLEGGALVRD